MGGGAEKNKTNAMLDSQNAQQQTEHNNYMNTVNTGLSTATSNASDMYGSLYGGYNSAIQGGEAYDPSKYGALTGLPGGASGYGGGGYAPDPRLGQVQQSYQDFMAGGGVDTGSSNSFQSQLHDVAGTGGLDPTRVASMDQNIQGFKNIAATGGVDDAAQARIRGSGVFDEFAKTGGYSDQDLANIRSRANSVIPSYYQSAKDDASRMATVQGGYGPGQAALFARMGRDQSKNAAASSLATETGIKDAVNTGREWGAGQVSSSEQGLQGLLSQNRLSALTGASTTEANMLNSIAQNRTGAASAGGSNDIGMQGLIQKGKLAGTQGLEGMANSAMDRAAAASSAGAASAAAMDANRKWQAQFDREGVEGGLSGMQTLYGSTPGAVDMYLGAANTGQLTNNTVGGRIVDQRMGNNPSTLQQIGGLVSGVTGAAGGILGGLGSTRKPCQVPGYDPTQHGG